MVDFARGEVGRNQCRAYAFAAGFMFHLKLRGRPQRAAT